MTRVADVEPLQWDLRVHPGEVAIGYASRLAALNGYDLPTLMRGTGVDVRRLHVGDEAAVRHVAALGALDPAETDGLVRTTPRRNGPSDSRIGSERLARRSLLTGFVRFCPHCIAGDICDGPGDVTPTALTWLRVEWMVEQIHSCHVHAIQLVETDLVAGFPLVDFSSAIATEVLPRLERLRVEAVPSKPSDFEKWVLRRLSGIMNPDDWLDRMPLYAAVDICEALGIETVDKEAHPYECLDPAERAAVSLAGFRVAQGAEPGIERFLDGLVSRANQAGYVGSNKVYGQIWRSVGRNSDPAFDPFRDIVRRHALDNVPFAAGTVVLGQVLEARRLHTMSSAARESRVCNQTLRGMFARPGVAPALPASERTRLMIGAAEFEERLREFGVALPVAAVVASTGIIHRHLLELIVQGVIPVLFGSRDVANARHRIARADLESFIGRLGEGAVPVEQPTRLQVNLGHACLVASTNIVELVSLVLAGRLTWKGRLGGGARYTDLLVDAGEVLNVLRQDRPPPTHMTKFDVGAEMRGMSHQLVGRMIRAGHLKVEKAFCPRVRRRIPLITRESFETFRGRYVTLTELGHTQDLHWRIVRRHLDTSGCMPTYSWDGRGNAIYALSKDLEKALATLPGGGAPKAP